MSEIKYRSEIDGLRAVAVILVVLFHTGLGPSGGYVGVDVFFVISGFLITGIILRGIENGTFSLVRFWERRILRIFPALFATVAVTLCVGYLLLFPRELEDLGKSSLAQAALLANVYFWRDTGYFAGPAELKPLLHTWSLAVEEQFYLFFPLLLLSFRKQSYRTQFLGLSVFTCVSFAVSFYGAYQHPSATFFLLPTRAWELMVGCLLAIGGSPTVSRPFLNEALGLAGIAAILLPAFLYDNQTPFPGLAALPPVVGTAAILYATAATPRTCVGRLLSLRPVVFVGLISYSLYLWHWPVIVYFRHYFGHFYWKQATLALICTLLCSFGSWKCIEQPFRRQNLLQSHRSLFATFLSLTTAMAGVSFYYVIAKGLPTRFPPIIESLAEDVEWTGAQYFSRATDEFELQELPAVGRRLKESNTTKLDFLIWSDSHGAVLGDTINALANETQLSGTVISLSGWIPAPFLFTKNEIREIGSETSARELRNKIIRSIERNLPRNIVLIGRWRLYSSGAIGVDVDLRPSDFFASDESHQSQNADESGLVLKRAIEKLAMFCEQYGITLWILEQVPEIYETSPAHQLLQYTIGRSGTQPNRRTSIEQHLMSQTRISKIFSSIKSPAVHVLDPAPLLFDSDGLTINYWQGRSCYRDNDHLTRWGAELLSPIFREMFTEMKQQKERKVK